MTVPTSTAKSGPYAGAGTVGPFTVGFRFLENAHLQVVQTSGTGIDTTLVLTTNYTVSGAGAASGSVTLVVALPVGQKLTIIRSVSFTQDADYVQNDAFPAESHERSLDKLTMQTQQLLEAVNRAAKLPLTSTADPSELVADVTLLADNITGLTTVYGSIASVNTVAGAIANVNTVAGAIANVNATGASIANVNTVATNITSVNSAATNMAAIIAAPTQASNAATSATNAAASYDSFDDRYLGPKATAPTLDNDGQTLLVGALYWDTAIPGMRAYTGTAWTTLPAATAGAVANTPFGSIAATTVQGAINEIVADLAAPSGASLIGSNGQVVASITALRALLKTSTSKNAFVTGYYTAGDGGGGAYWYDAADTTTADNGGTVIVATDGGRWKLTQTAMVSVKQFGAKGDGTTDDTGVFNACITALSGRPIYVPDPSSGYKITSPLTLPGNTVLVGVSKRSTKIIKAFNGDMVTLGDGSGLQNIWLEGNGVNGFTGRGVLLAGTTARQEVMNSRIVNTLGFPVDYTGLAAGSQSLFSNVEMNYYGATTGSPNVAVNMLAGFQDEAVPRTFVNIQTNGAPSFNFGGCNGVFISGSFLADLIYTTNSRDVQITNTRLANQASLVIDGHNNGIVGCDINAQVTIAAGADAITVGPNSYNNLPIIDGSGNNRNNLYHWSIAYTPTLTSGGTPPVLGNGSLTGTFSREGSTITVTVNLFLGSTTTLGTGGLDFRLPFFRSSGDIVECGNMVMNRGGTIYTAVMQIAGAANTAQPLRDTSGSVTFNSPATWAAGDTMRATMTFGV